MMETYTLSRALHLMRYGSKKMAPAYEYQYDGNFYLIENETLYMRNKKDTFDTLVDSLDQSEIMGSWIEVKE